MENLQELIEFYDREMQLIYQSLALAGDCKAFLKMINSNLPKSAKIAFEDTFYKAQNKYLKMPGLFNENQDTHPAKETFNRMNEIVDMAIAKHEVVAIIENPSLAKRKDDLLKSFLRNKFDDAKGVECIDIIDTARECGFDEQVTEMVNDLSIGNARLYKMHEENRK